MSLPDPEQMQRAQTRLEELMQRQEELDDDLVPWLDDSGPFGTSLKHPLLYSIVHAPQMNAMANERYRQQKKALAAALADERWATSVWIHERPHRLDAFRRISWHLDGPAYWALLGEVWSDTENSWQERDAWREMLTADDEGRELMSSADARSAFTLTPEQGGFNPQTRIYRGFCHEDGLSGFAWTLDRARAKWFAGRLREPGDPPARVAAGWVAREHIIAHITSRDEQEIVVLPEHVTGVEVEVVK